MIGTPALGAGEPAGDPAHELRRRHLDVYNPVHPAAEPVQRLVQLRRAATTTANRRALLYGAAFLVIALLVSTKLPLRPNEESH